MKYVILYLRLEECSEILSEELVARDIIGVKRGFTINSSENNTC